MSYLALLIAVVCETFLPDGLFTRARDWVDRFNQELEINLEALGAPGYTHLQRAQPVLAAHHLLAYVEMLDRDGLDPEIERARLPRGVDPRPHITLSVAGRSHHLRCLERGGLHVVQITA